MISQMFVDVFKLYSAVEVDLERTIMTIEIICCSTLYFSMSFSLRLQNKFIVTDSENKTD